MIFKGNLNYVGAYHLSLPHHAVLWGAGYQIIGFKIAIRQKFSTQQESNGTNQSSCQHLITQTFNITPDFKALHSYHIII